MLKFIIYLACFLCCFIGLAFLLAGSVSFFEQLSQVRKQTEAEIIAVEIQAFEAHDEAKTYTAYRTNYEVRYEAGGKTYQIPIRGNHISSSAQEAGIKSAKNPVGSLCPLYYLPDRPEDVAWDPLAGRIGFSLLFLSIGLTAAACGVLIWLQARPLDW